MQHGGKAKLNLRQVFTRKSVISSIVAIVVIVVSIGGFAYQYADEYQDTFLPRQSAYGIELSGLSPNEASRQIESQLNHFTIILKHDDTQQAYSPNKLGFEVSNQSLVDAIETRSTTALLRSLYAEQAVEVKITTDENQIREELVPLIDSLKVEPTTQVTTTYVSGKPSEVTTKGTVGRKVSNTDEIVAQILSFADEPQNIETSIEFEEIPFENKAIEVDDTLPPPTTYTYTIESRGDITSDIDTFAAQVAETLADARGWTRSNVRFKQVESGGAFRIILATPAKVGAASSGCSTMWSCRVGSSVYINEDRWNGATSSWNSAGGNLRDYRHMVVNHEVGHWLGHGHRDCPSSGKPAPVMQQQSINLQGCTHNPWPLESEV